MRARQLSLTKLSTKGLYPQAEPVPARLLVVLLALYLAQGLPIGFMTQALPPILRELEVSLTWIGFSGALLTPWALKFLWAPYVDQHYLKRFGRSKSWAVPLALTNALLLLLLSGLNLFETKAYLAHVFALLSLIALLGSTQDVSIDSLATRALSDKQKPLGNAMQVGGYRLGLIAGGGLLLVLLDTVGWRAAFVGLSVLTLLTAMPLIATKESKLVSPKPSVKAANNTDKWPWGHFLTNPLMRAWLMVLVTYQLVDAVSGVMVKPFMTDLGLSFSQIGWFASIGGSLASVVGALVAAKVLQFLPKQRALFWFLALEMLAVAGYALVSAGYAGGQDLSRAYWLLVVNFAEHITAALGLVAVLSYMMQHAREHAAGSDFSFQVCMLTLVSGVGGLVSGALADWLGYFGLFVVAVATGFLGLAALHYFKRVSESTAPV